MNELTRIGRNAALIALALGAYIAATAPARSADYTTDGRLIVGMGGACAKKSMTDSGRENPVSCNPADLSSYGVIWTGVLTRDPASYALFDARSGMIVAAEEPSRFLTPAPGEAARYWGALNDRRDRLSGLRRAIDVGATVTAR